MPKSFKGVMKEFGSGQLHSGSSQGKVVTNPKQALAIAYSEQRQMKHPHKNLGAYLHASKKSR